MHVTALTWGITLVVLIGLLAIDTFVIGRRPHVPTMRECLIAIGAYIGLALAFGVWVMVDAGTRYGTEFLAGWLTEYSLSVDNLFIFLLILTKMKVPRQYQQYALLVGIVLALVFRGLFIAAGAALISAAAWVFFIFGAFLIYVAVDLFQDYVAKDTEEEATDNFVIRAVRKRVPSTAEFHGTSWFAIVDGKRLMTPMLLVIVALGTTDVMFALDSIPAIYGLTQEPYLVFAANVFALMGLRQLYFLIGSALKKLVYLPLGLSFLLAFIGVKLLLHAMHHYGLDGRLGFNGEIPTIASLGVIVATLVVTTVASLVASRRASADPPDEPEADAEVGSAEPDAG